MVGLAYGDGEYDISCCGDVAFFTGGRSGLAFSHMFAIGQGGIDPYGALTRVVGDINQDSIDDLRVGESYEGRRAYTVLPPNPWSDGQGFASAFGGADHRPRLTTVNVPRRSGCDVSPAW